MTLVPLLQIQIARKSFDPQNASRSVVAGVKSMTNPHHTQKIDSEPSGMKMFMQKSDSPDARLSVTFMMSHSQHTYSLTATRSEKPAKPGLILLIHL